MLTIYVHIQYNYKENFLAAQWLGFGTFTIKSPGSVPGGGTNIPQTIQLGHQSSYKESFQGFPLWPSDSVLQVQGAWGQASGIPHGWGGQKKSINQSNPCLIEPLQKK